jgi:hypothetical protein
MPDLQNLNGAIRLTHRVRYGKWERDKHAIAVKVFAVRERLRRQSLIDEVGGLRDVRPIARLQPDFRQLLFRRRMPRYGKAHLTLRK